MSETTGEMGTKVNKTALNAQPVTTHPLHISTELEPSGQVLSLAPSQPGEMQLSPLLPPTSFWTQLVCSSLSWSAFQSNEGLLLKARKDAYRQRAREDPTQDSGQTGQIGMD